MIRQQDFHQACKQRFDTLLFQIFLAAALIRMFVRFPVCSAEQPLSVLTTSVGNWGRSKRVRWPIKRVKIHKKHGAETEQPDLSIETEYGVGQWIAKWFKRIGTVGTD